jgi:PAS domain S-box-containing protein
VSGRSAAVVHSMAQAAIELILFRQLATSLAVPVFLVDHNGDMVFLNEAAERLLGLRFDDVDELPFDTWSRSFQPRSPDGTIVSPESLPLVQAIMSRRPAHGPLQITGNDGEERSIEVTAFPLEGGQGRLIGAVAMFWERDEA